MLYFVGIFIFAVCVIGGMWYGLNYLRAKVNKTSVSGEILKSVEEVVKRPDAPK